MYLSRVCGDDPKEVETEMWVYEFVPRMRGWSRDIDIFAIDLSICPAYAGMILMDRSVLYISSNLSRVCGDDPIPEFRGASPLKFVPRMRGWSSRTWNNYERILICPAYAGMIPQE